MSGAHILISLAIGSGTVPTNLGLYSDHQSCRAAIRKIYETKMNFDLLKTQGVDLAPLNRAIDHQLSFQRQYVCVAANGTSTNQIKE